MAPSPPAVTPARPALAGALAAALLLTLAPDAGAAPAWVQRHIVLPEHNFSFDPGIAVAHTDVGPDDVNGVGVNLEAAFGITDRLELGFRTGLRFGNDGRATQADYYARLWDTDTYNTGTETLANPEARLRYGLLGGDVVELGLEARLWLPLPDDSEFGFAPGLPLLFHFGDRVRLDTGVLIPIIFTEPETTLIISFPVRLWFQINEQLWLGPVAGVRVVNDRFDNDYTQVPLGFGLGYQITSAIDLKTQLLFRDVDRDEASDDFGVGFGMQFRIE
ncbi:MAG TPA: hypothetical protein VFS43_43550 [Polyangiaceae bacterium]|nr:hypothetical protein [Polyangiaceae bacterium]